MSFGWRRRGWPGAAWPPAVSSSWRSGLPRWSGLVLTASFVLLVMAPNMLAEWSLRASLSGRRSRALFYSRLAFLLHPAPWPYLNMLIDHAAAHQPRDKFVRRLRELALT